MSDLHEVRAVLRAFEADRQETRLLRLAFPRGDGPAAVMLANRLEADEGLSRDFRYTVEVLSDNPSIELKAVQGKMVGLELVREDGSLRYFNGHVFEFRLVRCDSGYAFYNMVLLPWLAYLRLRQDNYIFHGKNLYDQTSHILEQYSTVADWKTRVTGPDDVMTDAVMYRESHHNYLHRRWAARGWHYWYEHRADGHTLVLGDDTLLADPIDGETSEIPWQDTAGSLEDDGIHELSPVRYIVPASVTVASFDFKNPRTLTAEVPTLNQQGEVLRVESYEYTGAYGFHTQPDGDKQARLRMEEIEADGKHFDALGNDRFAMPGRWFTLTGHFDQRSYTSDPDHEFLILEAHHTAQNNYLQNGMSAVYTNRLKCIRKRIPWRPGRDFGCVEPRIYGLQTATVVGPAGEEVWTDPFGRIKLQFHWDQVGTYDFGSSAWVRVSSQWAGSGYGLLSIPRVGQEVVVQFLDGNPDRPLVTGSVYNARNMPPWDLPATNHMTGLRTRSTPGGNGHCEMVIHDRAGQELVNIFSQKDMVTTVLNDQSTAVQHNQATVVNGPQRTINVTEGTQATTVKKAVLVTSETEHIQLSGHTAVELGAQTKHITLTAKTDIVLQVGKSTLHMSADGSILIEGVTVTVKGSGKVDVNP